MVLKKPLALVDGSRAQIKVTDVLDVSGPHFRKVTYASGLISDVEYFSLASMLVSNRVAKHSLTYTGDLLTSEVLVFYASDGTTIVKTFTWTHTYSGVDLQSSALAVT